MVNAIPLKSKVRIVDADKTYFCGTVTGIMIDVEGLQYRVAWWDGRSRKCEWLMEYEVETDGAAPVAVIGFARQRNN